MPRISVVVPCFNEAESLPLYADAMEAVADELRAGDGCELELVLVDDGSSDGTLRVMRSLSAGAAARGMGVSYLSFSRNFGKEAALLAGLRAARGDYVAVMDADLQDPPELLPRMYERLLQGACDCVGTRRETRRGEPPLRSAFARLFYRLVNAMSDTKVVDGARDYRLMTRAMVDAVLSLPEGMRFSKGIFGWVGFRTEWISYENVERAAGSTSWSFWGLARYAVEGMVAFSTVPLAFASAAGVVLCLLAVLLACAIVAKTLVAGDPVPGWPSLACLVLLIGGIQLLCLGVMGKYLANTYLEVKHRPAYIIQESSVSGEGRREGRRP